MRVSGRCCGVNLRHALHRVDGAPGRPRLNTIQLASVRLMPARFDPPVSREANDRRSEVILRLIPLLELGGIRDDPHTGDQPVDDGEDQYSNDAIVCAHDDSRRRVD